jgi:hypothetical protein
VASADDVLFLEPGLAWQPVSARLVTERRLPLLVVALVGVALVLLGVWYDVTSGAAPAVAVVVGVVLLVGWALAWWVFVPRVVRAWRYAERHEDLLVSRGRLWRRLTVVPYGRMQVIEVTANPVSRHLGIATVRLVTASASTDATIPGLPVAEAHRLRDRLAAKGEATTAGL